MLEQEIIPRLLARLPDSVAHYKAGEHMFVFRHNGATLRLGYLDKPRDIENYTGPEYVLILWDELTQFRRAQYVFMRSRLRMAGQVADDMSKYGLKPRMIATTNPGGIGHGWCKRMWVDPSRKHRDAAVFWGGVEDGEDTAGERTMAYIPARATDNPFLDIDHYRTQLAGLDPMLRRALEDGDWDILEGTRFSQFRRALHVVTPEQIRVPMVGFPRAVGVDYGLSAPFAALWGVKVRDTIIVYREIGGPNVTAENQARLILEAEEPGERMLPGRPVPIALDPSCWARSPQQIDKPLDPNAPAKFSIAWWYRQVLGSQVRKAWNDRIGGAQLFDHGMLVRTGGLPRLLISTACPNLIRTLPELLRSDRNPEDIATTPKQDDHWYDAARYLLGELMGGGHRRVADDPVLGEKPDLDAEFDSLLSPDHRQRMLRMRGIADPWGPRDLTDS